MAAKILIGYGNQTVAKNVPYLVQQLWFSNEYNYE